MFFYFNLTGLTERHRNVKVKCFEIIKGNKKGTFFFKKVEVIVFLFSHLFVKFTIYNIILRM